MTYINNDTFKTIAKLTPYGKNKIFLQGFNELITKFSIGDSDANYLTSESSDVYHFGGVNNSSIFENIGIKDLLIYDSSGTPFKLIEPSNNIISSKYNTYNISDILNNGLIINRKDNDNLLKTIHQPITENEISEFISGMYSNTILKDFKQDKFLIFKINDFKDIINGLNFKLSIDDIDLYTAFSNNTVSADSTIFDDSTSVTSISNNMALLFSDFIKKPKGLDELSWATGFKTFKPYSKNFKSFYNFNEKDFTISDKMVGYILLDLGLVVITEPLIIDKFSESSKVSYDTTTEKVVVYNELICQINRNEFIKSRNSTYLNGNIIKASEIGLYDNSNNLIALAKFNKQLEMTGTQPITISIVLSL